MLGNMFTFTTQDGTWNVETAKQSRSHQWEAPTLSRAVFIGIKDPHYNMFAFTKHTQGNLMHLEYGKQVYQSLQEAIISTTGEIQTY